MVGSDVVRMVLVGLSRCDRWIVQEIKGREREDPIELPLMIVNNLNELV